jgi:hypothetical protein
MAKRLAQKISNLSQASSEFDLSAIRNARAKEMDSWGKAVLKEKANRKAKFGSIPIKSLKESGGCSD